jgi:phosphoglycerate kinase
MAFTFLKIQNEMKIGKSLFDEEGSKIIKEIINKSKMNKVNIFFPIDFICSNKFGEDGDIINVLDSEGIPDDYMGLDIGIIIFIKK